MLDMLLVFLRYVVIFLLYFFLFHVLKLIARDLFSPPPSNSFKPSPHAFLYVRSTKNNSRKNTLKKGDVYALREITSIGRDQYNDIVLAEEHVSSKHALILRQGSTWILRDLGSTNGTYVNGIRVSGAVELHPEDTITIGGITLEMRWKDAG